MKHALLILCHGNIGQVARLVSFFDEDFICYIHVDKKYRLSDEEYSMLKNSGFDVRIYQRYKVNWGGIGILKAELYLLKEIVKSADCDYIHFFSGQDYPIKKLEEFKTFFINNPDIQYMDYRPVPNDYWEGHTYRRFELYRLNDYVDYNTHKGQKVVNGFNQWQIKHGIRRRIPDQFPRLFGGSNWMSITSDCARYIVESEKSHRRFFNRLRFTFASDEVYFHTVILNSKFKNSVKNDNKRLILWNPRTQKPTVLTKKNWFQISVSGGLVARKFDENESASLIQELHKYILNPDNDVEISESGCWCEKSLNGHIFDQGLALELKRLIRYLDVKTVGDFGCGPGWYVAMLRQMGIDAQGYDGNPYVEELSSMFFNDGFYCQNVDLTDDIEVDEPFQMIISLEVGEHIPKEKEDVFINNLANSTSRYLLLSWGTPGQPGIGHINCHTNEYVIDKLVKRGFNINIPVSNMLRAGSCNRWFNTSIMFFERAGS